MKEQDDSIINQNIQSQGGNATMQLKDQSQELGKALAAINRYILADEPNLRNGHGASRQEVDKMLATQSACLHILAEIHDPLVQAITAQLNLDRHHLNAGVMIRSLIHKADKAAK